MTVAIWIAISCIAYALFTALLIGGGAVGLMVRESWRAHRAVHRSHRPWSAAVLTAVLLLAISATGGHR